MAEKLNSYLDFAENDYQFFRASYQNNIKGTALAALGQSICERYLKHIIDSYSYPETREEESLKETYLKTHSLRRLIKYIEEEMEYEIPNETEFSLERIDGYYFQTRYPGEESFIPTSKDVDKAYRAVKAAREYTLSIVRENELEEELENADEPESKDQPSYEDDELEL